jgi:hypothetical protein
MTANVDRNEHLMESPSMATVPIWQHRLRVRLFAWISHDALGAYGRVTPRPAAVLVFSGLAGLIIVGLYRYGHRFGLHMPMFAKEGFAENLTFFLDFWAAVLCGLAAMRTHRQRTDAQDSLIVVAYWICAALLFFVAMDEIGWGQQLVTFQTPAAWSTLNYQQETTLHNLASRETLTFAWKIVGATFGIGVIALMLAAQVSSNKVLRFVAPHPSLALLGALTAYGGIRIHPEIAEVLISIFFAFYGYRIYVASPNAVRDRRIASVRKR